MRYVKLLSFLFIVFLFNSCGDNKSAESVETEQKEEDVVLYNIRTNDFDVIVDTVKKGELLSQILLSSGLDSRTIHTLITKCDTVFNVRKFKSGNTYTRMYSDTVLAYFIYDIGFQYSYLISLSLIKLSKNLKDKNDTVTLLNDSVNDLNTKLTTTANQVNNLTATNNTLNNKLDKVEKKFETLNASNLSLLSALFL